MGKKAPLLPNDYNPVGERLRRAISLPSKENEQREEAVQSDPTSTLQLAVAEREISESPPEAGQLKERELVPDIPVGRELKDSSFKLRCTESERKRWHQMAHEVTQETNTLSHFVRAALMLFEHSFEELLRQAPEIQRLKYPPKSDSLALTLYEQRLSQHLYEAIRRSGKPRG